MSSIFRRDDNYVEQPKRNTVDMSFQNNLTTRFGALNVCFCKPVMPGESYRIKPTFGLRYLPMVYPVQTRMKASINFFYVRNRNLWKDFPDFIGKTKEGLTPPYIHLTDNNRMMFETSQLGDYMGIPTKVYDKVYQVFESAEQNLVSNPSYGTGVGPGVTYEDGMYTLYPSLLMTLPSSAWDTLNIGSDFSVYRNTARPTSLPDADITYWTVVNAFANGRDVFSSKKMRVTFNEYWDDPSECKILLHDSSGKAVVYHEFTIPANSPGYVEEFDIQPQESWGDGSGTRDPEFLITMIRPNNLNWYQSLEPTFEFVHLTDVTLDVADMELSELPWRSESNPNGIPLSALPFRAYESIYNCFYRNAENNPLLINGVPEYNKWLRTQEGGADTNMYPIYYHNWEDDFLTTALPSPQQGNAPLVGLTGTPTLTVAHDDGTTTQMQLNVEEDGTVTGAVAQSGDTPTQNALIDAVSYGITINDFRNVNSFQRWLENNIRRGYKYKDQIKTHYGVSVRYDELDMPEFIGGVSESVMVNQISQTTPTETSPLGDMAGQASAVGQGRSIEHYCDEHGFIIGILCVKPVANYSQLLPKFFNITDSFDYYFPEFGHIGMQPITYAEVTPLQAFKEGKLNDVFGYQRAWYDLIASTDEVHGLFRSDFRNFLINRAFDGTPQLGAEFTVMDPDEINDVFAYQGNTDKILGQIYFEASKKTPIPLYGIPRLE